ncbi:MAG: hypothetical protein OJF49_003257 [Ktedonobacterales bacterium]|jgi:hypothetical protein|nr:MAG: hypothetical protein OJF49_003257 [Ktedonobacterales bacterium]
MNRRSNWQRIGQVVMGWLSPPWKPTAAALTLFVVWYLRPVLEAEANELRNALLNPLSESDGWLKSFAIVAHRTIIVELFVLCEALIIGAIVVALTNFAFFLWNRIRKGMRSERVAPRRERGPRNGSEPIPVSKMVGRRLDNDVA